MGFGNWIRGVFSGGTGGGYIVPARSAPPRRGTREFLLAYGSHPWVHGIALRIAREVAAALEWQLYDRPDGHPERKQVHDDPVLNFLRNPHPEIPAFVWTMYQQLWRELGGEAFVILDTNELGEPVRGTPIPPHWVTGTPTSEDRFFTVSPGLSTEGAKIPAANMLWLRDPDPFDPYGRGTGTARSLADEIDTYEYASQHTKAFFYNGAVPDVIASLKGAQPDELKTLDAHFQEKYGGPKKAHRLHWTGREMSVQRLDTSFKDMELVPLRREQRDTMLQVWGVPPEIFGILENSNRATIDAAYYLFAKGSLFPRFKTLQGEMQLRLVPRFGRRDRYLGFKNPIPEDRDFQLRGVSVAPSAFTRGEFRQLLGFLPGDAADEPLASATIQIGPTNLPPGKGADPAWAQIAALMPPKD